MPSLEIVNDVQHVLKVPPPVWAPLSEYVIDCTPDGCALPPESNALRLTNTLNRFQPFAFGAGKLALVVGGVESNGLTMTLKVAVATLPATSVAVTVSVVVPTGKVAPLASGETVAGPTNPLTESDADAPKLTTAPAGEVALVCTWNGKFSEGAVWSILNESVWSPSTLPLMSVA